MPAADQGGAGRADETFELPVDQYAARVARAVEFQNEEAEGEIVDDGLRVERALVTGIDQARRKHGRLQWSRPIWPMSSAGFPSRFEAITSPSQ